MFSVVSVINNPAKAEARLQSGLSRQNVPYQLIRVENCDGRFAQAASALNWGARHAKGDWIVFLHQDIELLSSDWLQRAESFQRGIDPNGWKGVFGLDSHGKCRGIVVDRAVLLGEPYQEPQAVQTLDEIVLIHRNLGPGYAYFDEGVPGWHAYGVEACCSAIRRGGQNYVLPLPAWHDSDTTNQNGLREAHAYVWQKHRDAFRTIYTSCGVLPWDGSHGSLTFLKRLRNWKRVALFRWAVPTNTLEQAPLEILERLTSNEAVVECIHAPVMFRDIEGVGFTSRPTNPRRILHRFVGLNLSALQSDCVVICPDVAHRMTNLTFLPSDVRRLLIWVYLIGPQAEPSFWHKVLNQPFCCHFALEEHERRSAVFEVEFDKK